MKQCGLWRLKVSILKEIITAILLLISVGCDVYYGPTIRNSTATTVMLKLDIANSEIRTVYLEPQSVISLGGARRGTPPEIKNIYLYDSNGCILKSLDMKALKTDGCLNITEENRTGKGTVQ